MKPNLRPFLSRLILILGSLVFTLGLVEIGMRVLHMPFSAPLYQPCIYQEDNQLGFRYLPNSSGKTARYYEIENTVQINSLGFHDVEHDLTDQEQIRVLALGDSFTAALYLPHEASWPQVSESILGVDQFEFFNLGMDGIGTETHLTLLEEYSPILEPDVVVLAFYENDLEDTNTQRLRECYKDYVLVYQELSQRTQLREFVDKKRPGAVLSWLGRHSYLVRIVAPLFPGGILLKTNYVSPTRAGIPVIEQPEQPITADHWFNQFLNLADTYDFQFLIVPIPDPNHLNQGKELLQESIREATFDRLLIADIEPQIEMILAQDGLTRQDMYWQNDGHLNAYGTAVYARVVSDFIQQHLE